MNIRVAKIKDMRDSKVLGFKGQVIGPDGQVVAEGPRAETPAKAKEALGVEVTRWLAQTSTPVVMYDWVEPDTIWMAYQGFYGKWGYSIVRRAPDALPRGASREGGGCGAYATREEAVERMRAHWFNNGPEAVVRGILGLCTEQREWTCPRCASVQRSERPYVCQAPRCGHVVLEEKAA